MIVLADLDICFKQCVKVRFGFCVDIFNRLIQRNYLYSSSFFMSQNTIRTKSINCDVLQCSPPVSHLPNLTSIMISVVNIQTYSI